MSSEVPCSSPYKYIHQNQIPLKEIKESTITKIEPSEANPDKLQKLLQSNRSGPSSKDLHQRQIIGSCIHCGQIPEYILTKYYDGVKLIEKLLWSMFGERKG